MSQSAPRVFITQENSQLNYGHAEEFGEVVFLTSKEVSPVPGSLINAEVTKELASKLESFDFDHDYIAPSGSPTVCGLAFLALGRRIELMHENDVGPKNLRILRWSNRDRVYQPITITL